MLQNQCNGANTAGICSDKGPSPFIANIALSARENDAFRTAFWTGGRLQMTLMSIAPRGEIGFEMHPNVDQFIRVEQGRGRVIIGNNGMLPAAQQRISRDDGVFIPAGTWHNIINEGFRPLKLSSIYAPPQHPRGTVHPTKAAADRAEK
jgi:mannose-6-phosphate isomerase-like protein (cupin superfamily)